MSEQNKAVVRRFLEAFANNDQAILKEVLAPDHTFHHYVSGITIERIKDGKIVERWFNQDELGMMQQLGLAPQSEAES